MIRISTLIVLLTAAIAGDPQSFEESSNSLDKLFKEFVGDDIPWVHFDIAGTAWGGDEQPFTQNNSATGAVIRLVLDLLGV